MGIPFIPARGLIGTDYMAVRPDFKVMNNPYGEDQIVLVPAISPEVSLIHAIKADCFGNCLVNSAIDDALLARASKKVIISAEQIVKTEELTASRETSFISCFHIDAVIHLPGGAYPTSSRGFYQAENQVIHNYIISAKDTTLFNDYLREFCRRLIERGISRD